MRRSRQSAFTIIELLTVMTITVILLTLIILPVFQSFNLTRQAQALADAQERGRLLTERISREVGDAVAVRGAGQVPATVNGEAIVLPSTSLILRLPKVTADGRVLAPREEADVVAPFAKMDLILPAETGQKDANGNFIDPVTGKIDPTLQNVKGQVAVPVAPGSTLVRWFVGLQDPFKPYNNPYDGLLLNRSGDRDNLYVLYRVEVQPRVFRNVAGTLRYAANTDFFEADADGNPILDDPRFFDPAFFSVALGSAGKTALVRNWLKKAVIVTQDSRYDMVQVLYDKQSRKVKQRNGVPEIVPLVQFRPTQVTSEPAESPTAARLGEESDGSINIAPDVFTTKLGSWSNATVRTWPAGWNSSDANANEFLIGRTDANAGISGYAPGFSIFAYDPDSAGDEMLSGTELFDVTAYINGLSGASRYPFSAGVSAANNRTGWLTNAKLRSLFSPYVLDSAKGKITGSFNISEVGDNATAPPAANPKNLPRVDVGEATTPRTATDLTGNFYDAKFAGVNNRFNKIWDLWEKDTTNAAGLKNLDPSRIHRFINLGVVPQGDGTAGPLRPELGFKASIVPGSETVEGPDQIPGPNFGNLVRYVRVNGNPGPNQYRINYTNLPAPSDYSLLGLTAPATTGFNAATYDPQNLVSAIFQPQYRAGYIQLNSDPATPLPVGNITVAYRFQFTGVQQNAVTGATGVGAKTDVFSVDYDSRELMSILLTMRSYPQSNLPNPQNITLKATAKVRNYIR